MLRVHENVFIKAEAGAEGGESDVVFKFSSMIIYFKFVYKLNLHRNKHFSAFHRTSIPKIPDMVEQSTIKKFHTGNNSTGVGHYINGGDHEDYGEQVEMNVV